ncbi:dioxygenase [Crenobacter cavernae]|uniref:Dioxygenase n=2 Tax=Crenobacter cavernae TaxID=2290923 RepID=A0ABY0FJF0_9NEIS|nr:dioxygenase [Crenobacter cavernae]
MAGPRVLERRCVMQTQTQPALFISHGAPELALETGPDAEHLRTLGRTLPTPSVILIVSAHWATRSLVINQTPQPATWHDFSGFPPALYDIRYPARSDTALAARLPALLSEAGFECQVSHDRPLDHGAWVPLSLMYPDASIPLVALSLPLSLGAKGLLRLGGALAFLRQQGVLIVGSGGYIHNLWAMESDGAPPAEWADAFSRWADARLHAREDEALADWQQSAPHAKQNHPTPEHFLPLFVALGAASPGATPVKLYDNWRYGSLSMACWRFD